MKTVLFFLLLLFTTPSLAQDCVVLLHGLGRSESSFLLMEEVLNSFDYKVVNQSYPSTEHEIDDLIPTINDGVAACGDVGKIHFVTHSMGGILLRGWLQHHHIENLGRSVMLGPPNHGSEIVDNFSENPVFEMLTGPAGQQLNTSLQSVPNQLGKANFEVGIIAGTLSLNPVLAPFFDGPNDGKVSVESTKLDGMADHITIATTHTFMMNNPLVIAQVLNFLTEGKFDHSLTLTQLFQRQLAD